MKIQTFSVVVGTNACNARCPYCVARMTPGKEAVKEAGYIAWRNFGKACSLCERNNVSTALITGKGEPTLYPAQVTQYVAALAPRFPFVELQTNGLRIEKMKDQYLDWYKTGLNTVGVSIVHWKDECNSVVMNATIPYGNLEEKIKVLHEVGLSVRLSCLLMNDYIDCADEVKKLIDFCKEHKVEQLTLRKLGAPEKWIDEEAHDWVVDHQLREIDYSAIRNTLQNDGTLLMKLMHGAEVYDYNGQNVCLTDCLTIEPEEGNIRQLIYFPDGHLRYDWQYEGAILL